MYVEINLTLDVREQDTIKGAIESAQNQMRTMDIEELISIMVFETNIHPKLI